jgi:short subunit dehydrogenase-like uncharacterized protein
MTGSWLLYGANGYTGALTARMAVERGMRPILAGRRADAVQELARSLGLEARVFGLEDPKAVAAGLAGVTAVLHAAGPFVRTSRPMAKACMISRVHYLDITGEAAVFEALAMRDAEAKAAGVMLLPGVGFDVVPSDCLAAHLARRLPTATHLALAFLGLGGVSRGTATTMAENAGEGGLVRRDGRLARVPAGWKTRHVDFGRGPQPCVTIPWGDVATAFHSTGIPNIEVYLAASLALRALVRLSRPLGGLLRASAVQGFLKRRIQAGPPGPTDEQRSRGRSFLWGEVTDDRGGRAVSRLTTPEGYTLTATASLAIVERALAGQVSPGFQTPSRAYGPDLVLALPGVMRQDE